MKILQNLQTENDTNKEMRHDENGRKRERT